MPLRHNLLLVTGAAAFHVLLGVSGPEQRHAPKGKAPKAPQRFGRCYLPLCAVWVAPRTAYSGSAGSVTAPHRIHTIERFH